MKTNWIKIIFSLSNLPLLLILLISVWPLLLPQVPQTLWTFLMFFCSGFCSVIAFVALGFNTVAQGNGNGQGLSAGKGLPTAQEYLYAVLFGAAASVIFIPLFFLINF